MKDTRAGMVGVNNYRNLALDWQPAGSRSGTFTAILLAVALGVILLTVAINLYKVPAADRRAPVIVPERIAKFMVQREKEKKPKPPVEQKKPEPKPLPKPEPAPKVARQKPSEEQKKPLTQEQQKARETAQNSGLLALSSELDDLIDTSEVSKSVAQSLRSTTADASRASGISGDVITAATATSGGSVNRQVSATGLGGGQLVDRAALTSANAKAEEITAAAPNQTASGKGQGNGRASEDISLVFDRNKGSLYTLYDRERRKSPGLKGKIVLQISIASSGDVLSVKVLSSALNSPSLESRLISRIKQFKFKPNSEKEAVIVTYPIEFLPS